MLTGSPDWEGIAAGVLGSLSLTWGGLGDIVAQRRHGRRRPIAISGTCAARTLALSGAKSLHAPVTWVVGRLKTSGHDDQPGPSACCT
jgi:hypothetical protein